jgi:hypothetical protein
MPIKSKAQRRKFAQLLVEGKITDEVYERWNREAGSKELPERVKPKPKAAAKRGPKRKTARRKARPKAKGARAKSRRPRKAK